MIPRFASVIGGRSPLVATAIHDGHLVRPEIRERLCIDEAARLREEDPHTACWTVVSDTRIVVHRSRFEVDINRPRELAIYAAPEHAWNLDVYREPLPPEVAARSLAEYDTFYAAVEQLLAEKVQRHGAFVVFDLHSYNHRRAGPHAAPGDPASHPEVNVGTGTMDRRRWAPVVDRFIRELAAEHVRGHTLDVRENVKFCGGYFPRWVHARFPDTGCAIAIEVKKTFIDEWTGELDADRLEGISQALAATVPGVIEELCKLTTHKRLRSA